MKIVLHDDHGGEHDVTEHVRSLYGHVVGSLDWGSDFLSTDERLEVLEIGYMAGLANLVEDEAGHQREIKRYQGYADQDIKVYGPDPQRERQLAYYQQKINEHRVFVDGLESIRKRRADLFKITDDVTDFDA